MKELNQLLTYAIEHQIIKERDISYYINILCNELNCEHFYYQVEKLDVHIDDLLSKIEEIYFKSEYADIRECNKSYIMNLLMPPPSFFENMNTLDFFKYMKDVNYIKTKNISKNVVFDELNEYGKIIISINLSKPEKDPLEIEKLKNQVQESAYPMCQLCVENEGFYGMIGKADRSNHRMIEYKKDYYFQFSPYQYYNEHGIVLLKGHTPMQTNRQTIIDLCDFVVRYPNYFIGSNADLPIVGGSILNHAHYQCGRFDFPLYDAKSNFIISEDNVALELLNWPLNVIKVSSENKDLLIEKVELIRKKWHNYTNEQLDIYSKTNEQHNTITLICRLVGKKFEMYVVLRNNIKSDEHPFGVFHPHDDKHFLKKENIGLIEVMGLAILPPRILTDINLYKQGVEVENYPQGINVERYIADTFTKVLEDCKVLKNDASVKEFMKELK